MRKRNRHQTKHTTATEHGEVIEVDAEDIPVLIPEEVVDEISAAGIHYRPSGLLPIIRDRKVRKPLERIILEQLGWGHPLTKILETLQVTITEYLHWLRIDGNFAEALHILEKARVLLAEDLLFQNVQKLNPIAQIYFLSNTDPDKWKDRRGEGSNKGQRGPVRIEITSSIPRPRRRKRAVSEEGKLKRIK